MQAIGARNHIKSIAKDRESQKQQLQVLIAEKKVQLERFAHHSYMWVCYLAFGNTGTEWSVNPCNWS